MSGDIIVGVGAVVLRNNREILLVKRAKKPGRGYWAIPGGHLEYGETLAEAAIRELEEETGIRGEPLGIVWVDEILPGEGSCRNVDHKHYVLIDILVKPENYDVKAGSDALDAGFFPINNPPRPITSSTLRLIEYLRENISGRRCIPVMGYE